MRGSGGLIALGVALAVGAVGWLATSGLAVLVAIGVCLLIPAGFVVLAELTWLATVPREKREAFKRAQADARNGGRR